MASQVSDFVARFFVSDQATHRLTQMEQAAQRFAGRISSVGQILTNAGTQFGKGMDPGAMSGVSGADQKMIQAEIQAISQQMLNLGKSGTISAGQLDALNTRLETLHRLMMRLGAPVGGIESVQKQMGRLTAVTRQASMENSEAGKSMQFMGDATDGARRGVLQMAAASQGVLAGMAALDGNIQHLALSLIFLQFTGALKTSIAFGGLTLAIMGSIKMIERLIVKKRAMEALSSSFAVFTQDTEAYSQATDKATFITEQLGLAAGNVEPNIEGLRSAMLLLTQLDEDAGDLNLLKVFQNLLFIMKRTQGADGKMRSWEEATKEALSAFEEYVGKVKEEGDLDIIDVLGTDRSLEEFYRMGAQAGSMLMEGIGSLLDLPINYNKTRLRIWWREWVEEGSQEARRHLLRELQLLADKGVDGAQELLDRLRDPLGTMSEAIDKRL